MQPYIDDLREGGKTKMAVIDGNVTLTRTHHSSDALVNAGAVAELKAREATLAERKLARRAFDEFNERYSIRFMRMNVVGPDDSLKLNEFEVINPFAAMDEIFTPEQHAYHYDAMLKAFRARPEKVSGLPVKYAERVATTFL